MAFFKDGRWLGWHGFFGGSKKLFIHIQQSFSERVGPRKMTF
jgi:hypothetical protein